MPVGKQQVRFCGEGFAWGKGVKSGTGPDINSTLASTNFSRQKRHLDIEISPIEISDTKISSVPLFGVGVSRLERLVASLPSNGNRTVGVSRLRIVPIWATRSQTNWTSSNHIPHIGVGESNIFLLFPVGEVLVV